MNNLIVGIVIALLGGLALFFKSKSDTSGAEAIEAKVDGEDSSLVKQQNENQIKLDQVNKDIQDLKDEKKRLRDQYLTNQQKADEWKKE